MVEIKVSITVPVYNVKDYLPKCLDSLIAQTLRDIEIILVDDGSTDGSGSICDEYAQRDNRVRVIHKENGGLASARQVGLEHARGTYLIACDSDDWVEANMYERLYTQITQEDADMAICDFYYNYPDGHQTVAHNCPRDCAIDNILRDVLMRRITGSACNKLVKTDLYTRYHLYWEQGVDLGEDVFMFLKLLQHPIKVTTLPEPLYHYKRASGSNTLTNTLTMASFTQAEHIHAWKREHIDAARFGRELFCSVLDYAYIGIRAKDMTSEHYQAFVKQNIPYADFFKYKVLTPKSCLILASKLFGLPFAKRVNRLLYKYWYK